MKDNRMAHFFSRRFLVIFILLYLALLLTLVTTLTAIYGLEKDARFSQVKVVEEHALRLSAAMLKQTLSGVYSDLGYLATSNALQDWLTTANDDNLAALNQEFRHFSQERRSYDQIRFLDLAGMERCRVNFDGQNAVIVPGDALQDKAKRYYFRDTIMLPQGKIYASPFDLNIEHGQVEIPYKPMIRFAMAVFNRHGQRQGLIVLNYLGAQLLENIEKISQLSPGDIYLYNREGYRLCLGQGTSQCWGFMFADRQGQTLQIQEPQLWQHMLEATGVFQKYDGNILATTLAVAPLRGNEYSSKLLGEREWFLLSIFSDVDLAAIGRTLRHKLWIIGLLLATVGALPVGLVVREIMRRQTHAQRITHLANYDILTNLPNRSLFHDRLQQAIMHARRRQEHFALLFIDLDGFKAVNDNFGHDYGDALLVEVGQRLREMVRTSDTVARLGGDEFTIILTATALETDATLVAEKIITRLTEPFIIRGEEIRMGASIGVAIYPEQGSDNDNLLKAADRAMYQAKNGGRNRVMVASKP